VYVRKVDGRETTFGVSGKLWRDALVLYDRRTKSLWTQVDGRALKGPARGQRLEELPSVVTTWGDWKRAHPDSLVLRPDSLSRDGSQYEEYVASADLGILERSNPDDRLHGKTVIVGVRTPELVTAVPLGFLEEHSPLNSSVGDDPILIVSLGLDGAAFHRTVNDVVLEFRGSETGLLRDLQTLSLWDPGTGRAVEGPLAGRTLERLPTRRSYWFVWATFHPDTELLYRSR
jgi:hypothetical protein